MLQKACHIQPAAPSHARNSPHPHTGHAEELLRRARARGVTRTRRGQAQYLRQGARCSRVGTGGARLRHRRLRPADARPCRILRRRAGRTRRLPARRGRHPQHRCCRSERERHSGHACNARLHRLGCGNGDRLHGRLRALRQRSGGDIPRRPRAGRAHGPPAQRLERRHHRLRRDRGISGAALRRAGHDGLCRRPVQDKSPRPA